MKKLFIIFALFICVGQAKAQKAKNSSTKLSSDVIKNLLESIPSSLETCILLKDTGVEYDSTLLNN